MASILSTIQSNAAALQQEFDQLILGQTLSVQDQQALASNLDTSQKAVLAQKAQTTQTVIFVSAGAVIIGITIFLIFRHNKKSRP